MIRDIKNHKTQFLSIFLMAFLGVFVFAGIGGEYTGFEQSVNNYYDATNLADGWIYSNHLDNAAVDKVDNLSATKSSERQLVINSVADFSNDPDVTLHFVENNDISKFYLVEGKDVDIDGMKVLASVGLDRHANQFPSQLSGGEQQRVSIARAVAKKPAMLLCDEPTGALDSRTGVSILSLLQNMSVNNNSTVVIVTHNAILAEAADKVIRIKNGKIEI